MSIYEHKIRLANVDKQLEMQDFQNKVILIVNVASQCGFTPQYEQLESLYKKYKDNDFLILGFPCNQFANQEPGNEEDIVSFCSLNYDVSFPICGKVDVNGDDAHPLYKELKDLAPGTLGKSIKWNFTKFLISKNADSILRFAPATKPFTLEKHIKHFLNI